MATKDTETESKADKASAAKDDPSSNVVKGASPMEVKTVEEQAKEARNEDDPKEDNGGKVDTRAAEANYTDEQKFKDLAKEAKVEHLESLGIDPDAPNGGGIHKVETGANSEKLYSGIVTVTSVSGEYENSKISTRINVGEHPRGLSWLKYAFKQHFPSADTDAMFEVDPENKADPLLRTKFG